MAQAQEEGSHVHVLHVTNDFQDNGTGITNAIRTLAQAQLAGGAEVTVLCETPSSPLAQRMAAAGAGFLECPHTSGVRDAVRLGRRITRVRSDVVHVHTGRAAAGLVFASRLLRSRSVATMHNTFQRSSLLMTTAARVVHISDTARADYARSAPWATGRSRTIRNAVELGLPAGGAADAEGLPAPGSVVYVGGLHHRKGVDVLLTAVELMAASGRETAVHVYGNRDEPVLEERFADLVQSGSVRFEGFTPHVREVMAAAGVVVIPSRQEPFGLVAAEARAAGAAVVASDVGGLRDVLAGGAGVLVPPDDAPALAGAITRVLDDPVLHAGLRRAAGRDLHQFEPATMALEYAKVYEELLSR